MDFLQKLKSSIQKSNSLLCVGLDPDLDKIPQKFKSEQDPIFAFNKNIIDQTKDFVCVYKPDTAFYEAYGIEGLKSMKKTIEYIPSDIPIILDAKRGSVRHTAELYAKSAFEYWNVDAVTLHIFTGRDGVIPFLKYKDRFSFFFIRSSNPSASDFQDINVNGKPFYEVMAEKVASWKEENYGIIAPATYPQELKTLRSIFPERFFLVPGIGAQGGDLEQTLKKGLTQDKSGLIISSSRGILYAQDPRLEVQKIRDEINIYRNE